MFESFFSNLLRYCGDHGKSCSRTPISLLKNCLSKALDVIQLTDDSHIFSSLKRSDPS